MTPDIAINTQHLPIQERRVYLPSRDDILPSWLSRVAMQQMVSSDISSRTAALYALPTAPNNTFINDNLLVEGIKPQIIIKRTPTQIVDLEPDAESSLGSTLEKLNQIKTTLALSMTQMAELFGVTRKTVYDWYEGAAPRADKENRIRVLLDTLTETPSSVDLKRLKAVWNIQANGSSFLSIFNDDRINSNDLQIALKVKFDELSQRMAANKNLVASNDKAGAKLNLAELDQFSRYGDFGE